MGSTPSIELSAQALGAVFPFHLAVDRDLTLAQVGDIWARLNPAVVPGTRIDASFRIVRPTVPFDFDVLRAQPRAIFILECLATRLQLRGQMFLAAPEVLLFPGSVFRAPRVFSTAGHGPVEQAGLIGYVPSDECASPVRAPPLRRPREGRVPAARVHGR